MKRRAAVFLLAIGLGAVGSRALAQEPVQLWDEAYISVRAGVTVRAVIHLSIEDGHYVVAANAKNARVTALALKMEPTEDITLGAPEYPKPGLDRLPDSTLALPVYEGLLEIGLPMRVSASAKWESKPLQGTLVYQPCDRRKCLPPTSMPIELSVEIRPARDNEKR